MKQDKVIRTDKGPCAELYGRLRDLADSAAELIYPTATYCIVCGNYVDSTRSYAICDHCIRRIEWGKLTIDPREHSELLYGQSDEAADDLPDSVTGCFRYGLYGRRVVFELKYNGHSYVARVAAQMMADRVRSDPSAAQLLDCDIVAAVPISRQKLKKRGFNQAEKLAKYFCRLTGMYHAQNLLMRVKDTEALRSLSPQERYMKLENAFALDSRRLPRGSGDLHSEKPLKDMSILLIDDIYTTGATARHCTRLLKNAGASKVHLLVPATRDGAAEQSENEY